MYQSKKPYLYGTGRRKSSVARVHLFPNGTGAITINGRNIDSYFGLDTLKMVVRQPLVSTDNVGKMDVVATVTGGGVSGQAGALRHGISRALLLASEDYRPILKKAGFSNPGTRKIPGDFAFSAIARQRLPTFNQISKCWHFCCATAILWEENILLTGVQNF
ncbi:MAG: 30S ribosomal protein S9 [Oscillospiraceae bacterium]